MRNRIIKSLSGVLLSLLALPALAGVDVTLTINNHTKYVLENGNYGYDAMGTGGVCSVLCVRTFNHEIAIHDRPAQIMSLYLKMGPQLKRCAWFTYDVIDPDTYRNVGTIRGRYCPYVSDSDTVGGITRGGADSDVVRLIVHKNNGPTTFELVD